MKKYFLLLFTTATSLFADICCPPTRTDSIPYSHVADTSDDYLTGYIQALVDMHYYEFQVRIIVRNQIAYILNLPNNEVISNSIICFVYDVPCIACVERVDCCLDEFLSSLDEQTRCDLYSCLYQDCACHISGIWFPQNTLLFLPLIADPRQVMNAAALRFNDSVIGKHVGAASFGDDFIFFRFKDVLYWQGDMDLGIEAGIFSVFDLDHTEACFVNSDFYVAALITYAFDKWSFRFRLWHLSSHIGDEFLICNPDFQRKNLSDEGVDFFASYQWNRALRLYAGIGDIFDRDDSFPEHPLYLEWGTEIRLFGCKDRYNKLYIQPFLAMHFRAWEEHDFNVDQNYALGVEYSKLQGVGRKFRIFAEYHNGFSKEGQFAKCESSYFDIKINYGF